MTSENLKVVDFKTEVWRIVRLQDWRWRSWHWGNDNRHLRLHQVNYDMPCLSILLFSYVTFYSNVELAWFTFDNGDMAWPKRHVFYLATFYREKWTWRVWFIFYTAAIDVMNHFPMFQVNRERASLRDVKGIFRNGHWWVFLVAGQS